MVISIQGGKVHENTEKYVLLYEFILLEDNCPDIVGVFNHFSIFNHGRKSLLDGRSNDPQNTTGTLANIFRNFWFPSKRRVTTPRSKKILQEKYNITLMLLSINSMAGVRIRQEGQGAD